MKTIYVDRNNAIGYGPRIFVPYEHSVPLRSHFDALCTWGGADKDTGKAKGWEFPSMDPKRLLEACAYAERLGYAVVELTPQNANNVWPRSGPLRT